MRIHPTEYVHQQEHPFPISEFSVITNKASGPDGIPSWVIKENADLLAAPVADILNSSFLEECGHYTSSKDLTC